MEADLWLLLLYEEEEEHIEEEDDDEDLGDLFDDEGIENIESDSDYEEYVAEESAEEYEDPPEAENAARMCGELQIDPEFHDLLQRLQVQSDEENRYDHWCFPDNPRWGRGEQRPPPTPDPEGRLQNTSWCRCGHCAIMSHVAESVCCREVRAMERFLEDEPCVTRHLDFPGFILSRDLLIQLLQFSTKLTASKFAENENGHLREAAYRKFTNVIYGFLGRGRGLSVPSCVVRKIRETFPSPDGSYTGFKWYSEYASGPLAGLNF
ncbi:uncharacterized protein ACNLHF_007988 [Anomaloglossus baeobatrachus]|uniref:uncharacterized protein LOC142255025 n=1 Tax=Anomaloglossus baeobatrachus TaxID=238106 RepID=UPI003F504DA8